MPLILVEQGLFGDAAVDTSAVEPLVDPQADRLGIGLCRTPVVGGFGSGGLSEVIVPGEPDASVLVYRMQASSLGIRMPEFVRLIDDEGVSLIADWIAAMEPTGCD